MSSLSLWFVSVTWVTEGISTGSWRCHWHQQAPFVISSRREHGWNSWVLAQEGEITVSKSLRVSSCIYVAFHLCTLGLWSPRVLYRSKLVAGFHRSKAEFFSCFIYGLLWFLNKKRHVWFSSSLLIQFVYCYVLCYGWFLYFGYLFSSYMDIL